jgi:MFS family permease
MVAREVEQRYKLGTRTISSNGDQFPRTPVPEQPEDPDLRGGNLRPSGKDLGWRVASIAAVLGCRDFAGLAILSLGSIYLQKAHHLTAARTGFILGFIMLLSIVVNPIAVWLSPGRRRLPTLGVNLVTAGLIVAATPMVPVRGVLWVLMAFMTFQLGSYAVSDAAILERVEPHVRGRVVGIFLTLAGTFSSISPWVMGFWTDALKERASDPAAYTPIFGALSAMMIISAFSLPLIKRLGPPVAQGIDPITETSPATLESVF